MTIPKRTRRRECDLRHLEERYDGTLAPPWRRAAWVGSATANGRDVAAADAALIDRLARDCVRAAASARRRRALDAGERRDAAALSGVAARLYRLRETGLAALAGEDR